jgi:hypothetical protein
MQMDAKRFIEVMTAWDRQFRTGADQPVIGASEDDLRWITVPACVVPGNDKTHPRSAAEALARLMPNAVLHELMGDDLPVEVDENWGAKETALAEILSAALARMTV